MRIGILTYHSPCNFGANLQALSNFRYLRNQGHDVHVIDYRPVWEESLYRHVPKIQADAHEDFLQRNLILTNRCSTSAELLACCRKYEFEKLIVGSDAVWSIPKGWDSREELPPFFMKWLFDSELSNKMEVSSISVAHMGHGFSDYPVEVKNDLKRSFKSFSKIYVRDKWTKLAVENIIDDSTVNVSLSADPVFSLTSDLDLDFGFGDFVLITPIEYDFLRPWVKRFKTALNRRGVSLVELPIPDRVSTLDTDYKLTFPLDPMQWFDAIGKSSGFIGVRFHAIVSAITQSTPFLSVDTYGSSTKMVKILNRIGCYRLGRLMDQKSKIYQLLNGTGYESCRVNGFRGLLGMDPEIVVESILSQNKERISQVKVQFQNSHKSAIDTICTRG